MAPSQGRARNALVPKKGELVFPLLLPKSLRCGVQGCIGLSGSGTYSGPDRRKKKPSETLTTIIRQGGKPYFSNVTSVYMAESLVT